MSSKTKALILFLFAYTFIPSCDSMGSCPEVPLYIDIIGIKEADQSRDTTVFAGQPIDSIAREEYEGFYILYDYQYYFNSRNPRKTAINHTGSFGNLMALSCANDGDNGTEEFYKSITVISLYDFDSLRLAGDTLNDIVTFRNKYSYSIDSLANHPRLYSADYQIARGSGQPYAFFGLSDIPAQLEKMRLKIIIQLSSGDVFEYTFNEVRFK